MVSTSASTALQLSIIMRGQAKFQMIKLLGKVSWQQRKNEKFWLTENSRVCKFMTGYSQLQTLKIDGVQGTHRRWWTSENTEI